jgi:RNA polymerase sigma-70 factor (sigma-B/F/G subfamily)
MQDDDAIQARVLAHLDLADAIARRFPARSGDADDVRQVARMGLVNAARRFDPERGADFVPFATATIRGEIKRYVRDNGWLIRPPRRLQELFAAIRAVQPALRHRLHRAPSPEELADELGLAPAEVREAIASERIFQPGSLDGLPREDAPDDGPQELIGDEDPRYDRAEAVALIAPACRGLPERHKRILYLRFFQDRTQSEIAEELGVSQVQVSRLLASILGGLRRAIDDDGLGPRQRAA